MVTAHEACEQGQMRCLQLLNTMTAKRRTSAPTGKALMYVEAYINCIKTQVLIDIGAMHNFIKRVEVRRLGLYVEKEEGFLKSVNAAAKPLDVVVRGVDIHMGKWRGEVNFSVAPLDDFDVVLGMKFLKQYDIVPLPQHDYVCIMQGGPYMILTVDKPKGGQSQQKANTKILSAIQLMELLDAKEKYIQPQ